MGVQNGYLIRDHLWGGGSGSLPFQHMMLCDATLRVCGATLVQ